MEYNVINSGIYFNAFTGAQSGMFAAGLWVTDTASTPSASDPVNVNSAAVAQAYAQEMDTLFAATNLPVDCYTQESVRNLSLAVFWQRNPSQANPPQNNAVTGSSYSKQILAILAMIAAGETNFASWG